MKYTATSGHWIGTAVLLVLVIMSSLAVTGLLLTPPGNQVTPSGNIRNGSYYVIMRDGVRIAVDVWLPANLEQDRKIPALMRTTRYIRARESGFIRRIALGLGLEGVHPMVQLLTLRAMRWCPLTPGAAGPHPAHARPISSGTAITMISKQRSNP